MAAKRFYPILTVEVALKLLCLLGLLLLSVWLWAEFLNRFERHPHRVRKAMYSMLALLTLFDVCLCACGITELWLLVVSLLVTSWGWLDAALRYPAPHGAASFFTFKQVALLVLKARCLGLGMLSVRRYFCTFVGQLGLTLLALPLYFYMAVPLHPLDQKVPSGAIDEDVAVHLTRFLASGSAIGRLGTLGGLAHKDV